MKARCYREFCCYGARFNLTDFGQGQSGPFNPAQPVYEYRGVWGFCGFHKPEQAVESFVPSPVS